MKAEIKREELRVGNKIWNLYPLANVVETIEQINKEGIVTVNGEHISFSEDLVGIPLTPDMLLKAGFTHFKSNDSYQLDSDDGYTIWGRVGVQGFDICETDSDNSINKEPLLYLHQIQNLIFALSGTELTIDL